jgi:hypothetical protein
MWSVMACSALPLLSQLGCWECQTRVWPRSSAPMSAACWATWSPPLKLKLPWVGSVASHFIEFSAVTLLNSRSSVEA